MKIFSKIKIILDYHIKSFSKIFEDSTITFFLAYKLPIYKILSIKNISNKLSSTKKHFYIKIKFNNNF